MKIFVQWTTFLAQSSFQIDSNDWGLLGSKAVPPVGRARNSLEGLDAEGGWVYSVNVQGMDFAGADHYAVEAAPDGGVKVTDWFDDPEELDPNNFWGEEWLFLPLAPDPKLGGAINTRQYRTIYAAPGAYRNWTRQPMQNTTVRRWDQFVPPSELIVRHGIWIPDNLKDEHEGLSSDAGWRDWGEHLASMYLDRNGRVKSGRSMGLYGKPDGTITYFLHDTALATGVHVADEEREMEETDVAVPVNLLGDTVGGGGERIFTWTTLSGSPNDADWPSGDYRCQIDVNQLMRIDSYGFRTQAGVAGHFARVDSGLTADQETFEQTEPVFTTTGIQLATTGTINPAAGAASNRAEWLLIADTTSESMAGAVRISVDDSDSFADGPWVAAVLDDAETIHFRSLEAFSRP